MCGIFGILSNKQSYSLDYFEKTLNSVAQILRHRGPDHFAFETLDISSSSNREQSSLSLGHTRLSIIDLSDGGHQPMSSADGRFIIVFNGEIYNFKELRTELSSIGYEFTTESDTEVLLHAWAEWNSDSLSKLVGMFAFAIYDKVKQTLTLVRDAFGIKPLYYWQGNDTLCFASEVQALIKLLPEKPKPNLVVGYKFLSHGTVDRGDDSFFEGIKHLKPGHILELNIDSTIENKISRWWNPSIEENQDIRFDDAKEIVREKFLRNVRLHLRSDVPVGAALSGGIDSSAVVCAMRYLEPSMELNTFSYVARDSTKNEEIWVDYVNEYVGAKSHKVTIEGKEMFSDLETLIELQGEPFASSSIYAQYKLFQKVRDAGVIVNLDGQGADEMLAGYFGYPHARFESLISEGKVVDVFKLWNELGNTFGSKPTKALIQTLLPNIYEELRSWRDKDFDRKFLKEDFCSSVKVNRDYRTKIYSNRALCHCLKNALNGHRGLVHLLRYEDRNSMIHSVESRVPFLTTDLVEFLLTLPEDFLLSNKGTTKYIFREAMKGIVPDRILQRKDKIGFETPEKHFLVSRKKEIIKQINLIDEVPFFDSSKIIKYLNNIDKLKMHEFSEIWRILNYFNWYKLNF
jgi:asparagine synthase (glutamine-hydrolysing)